MFLLFVFLLTIIFGRLFLTYLQNKKYIQPIYDDALEGHKSKAGTPTMGGIIIVFSFLIGVILFAIKNNILDNSFVIGALVITIGYSYIGFRDDILKVTKNDNQSGLTPIQKLIFQFGISIVIIYILIANSWDTNIMLFNMNIELGILYYLLVPIMIVAFSNASNLTDGLDGLLTSVSIVSFGGLFFLSFDSSYEVSRVIMILIVVLIGFLMYNANPAKMFMGDTGSLFIGALFAYLCIILKVEILSLLIGFVYLFETITVVIQVSYFKYSRKKYGEGRRVFLVAPYHHHLEAKGMSEKKVVMVACLVQAAVILIVLI